MRTTALAAALPLLLIGLSGTAEAQLVAEPLPGDPNLVQFQYDPNNSFRIFTRPLAATHIELERDERLKVFVIGDSASWMAQTRENNIFIKPRYPNITTPATLITTKRTYQLLLRATTESGRWYQRVSFQNPDAVMLEASDEDRLALTAATQESGKRMEEQPPVSLGTPRVRSVDQDAPLQSVAVMPDRLNFDYDVIGDSEFRPTNVFDDGEATYIQLRRNTDAPALFRIVSEDEIELVEYILKGNTIIVPNILKAGVLKIGREEVRFYNKRLVASRLFGGYDVNRGAK